MGSAALDIASLSKAERLQLLEEIWDSLDAEVDVPVTEAQRAELKARSRALRDGRMTTTPVDDLLKAIRERHASR